jgi:hypothetical protein
MNKTLFASVSIINLLLTHPVYSQFERAPEREQEPPVRVYKESPVLAPSTPSGLPEETRVSTLPITEIIEPLNIGTPFAPSVPATPEETSIIPIKKEDALPRYAILKKSQRFRYQSSKHF